ncbi:uncharacterized protein C8A04DRAFT_27497 [Dichotomopilus funicola]|uniref:Uncharacterized protein n=1 Tax=Dichotomopilus funicola TaxID=1934379 RepID=A0AAN6ZNT9_9PEZI|nr:hypothetical protein C8A04DRAFT_27497 [Dichotomopilus funicola]
METESADDILRKAALDGSMDYSTWPDLLPVILARIEKTAHTEFSIPNLSGFSQPARPASPRFLAPLPSSDPFEAPEQTEISSSQGTNKENADPSSPSAVARNTGVNTRGTEDAPATQSNTTGLPKPIADILDEILSVLRTDFTQYPPHTIQRLSELVLHPKQHYRHLVPYLHALDRVVHVTSGANIYPLPPALPDVGAMSLLANGVGNGGPSGLSIDIAAANNVGSDEALGGALLTPIPWLSGRTNGGGSDDGSETGGSSPLSSSGDNSQSLHQQQQQQQRQSSHIEGRVRTESTETIEGPNGMGSIETVSVSVNGIPSTGATGMALLTQRSVTQGELLRQEQRAGLVPLNQINRQQQQQLHQQQLQAQAQAQAQTSAQNDPGDHTTTGATTAEEEDTTMTEGGELDEAAEETPHARGPGEIGMADTGPQSAATANFIAGTGGSPMVVQGIDVEAAVGRSPAQQQSEQEETAAGQPAQEGAGSSSTTTEGGPADLVAQSPKREAGDALEPESPVKRRREGADGDGSGTGSDGDEKPDPDSGSPQKVDAEGDVVLSDAAASEETSAADPAPAQEGEPKDGAEGERDGVKDAKEGESKASKDGDESSTLGSGT